MSTAAASHNRNYSYK